MNEVTKVLCALRQGDRKAAGDLLPLVYHELRELAAQRLRHEAPGNTLQSTALVHEAYLRLVDAEGTNGWDGRGHFFAAAAEAMRHILVDGARRRRSLKRGGARQRIGLTHADPATDPPAVVDLLALDDALARLEQTHPRKAALVKLRFFAGLSNEAAADALGISTSTADNDWSYARAWLRLEMDGRPAPPAATTGPTPPPR
jgi:RNA polymerase sigma factor (TIGR02999 family)